MCAAVASDPAGAVVFAGPPRRGERRRREGAAVGFAPRLVGPIFMVASCASVQAAAALASTVFVAFGPAGTGALRFLVAAAVLMVFVRPRLRDRTAREWLMILALGATFAAMNLCLYAAIARVPLGVAVTLQYLGPLAVALRGARRRRDIAWALCAGAGVAALTGSVAHTSPAGIGLALAASAITAGSIVLSAQVAERTTHLDGLTLAVAAAALLTLPIGLPAAWHAPDIAALAAVFAVGALGAALPYALEFHALRRVKARTFGTILSLDPAVAGLVGLVLLGQRLTPAVTLGIALIIVANAGVVRSRR